MATLTKLQVRAAILFLSVGSLFVPPFGWLVGVVLLWTCPAWSTGRKLQGTFIVPGGFMLPAFLTLWNGQSNVALSWLVGVVVAGEVLSLIFLARAAEQSTRKAATLA